MVRRIIVVIMGLAIASLSSYLGVNVVTNQQTAWCIGGITGILCSLLGDMYWRS